MIIRLIGYKTFALALLFIASCDDEPDPMKCTVPPPGLTEISELLNAAEEQVTIGETTMELHAIVATDPLFGVTNVFSINWLVDVDSVAIPENVMLSEQYVINGDELWMPSYTEEGPETAPYEIERISRNGPEWNPQMHHDVEVTVIARVIDLEDCSEYYLITRQIMQCDC